MKKELIIAVILSIFIPSASHTEGATDIPVGKVEFISSARCEAIIRASSDSGLAVAAGGSVLYTADGKNRVTLTVTGSEGRFIRCTFRCSGTGKPELSEGAAVYFAESDNKAAGYADLKVLIHRLIGAYREFILAMESAEDPAATSAAINRLADSIELLIPEINRLNKRYPDLNRYMVSPPEEIKADVELLNQTGPLVSDAFYRISKMPPHKSVDEVLKRLKGILDRMWSSGK